MAKNFYVYKPFEHWFNKGGNVWLYSDPHFSDSEMIYIRKNYIGDDEQIKSINAKVGKKDVIIFLGDIGNIECIKKIRGYKILIMGNHDTGITNYQEVFNEVYNGPIMINNKIMLSHERVDLPFIMDLHGHEHSGAKSGYNHINFCAELINYTPVSLLKLVRDGILKNIDDIHRITIDNATTKKFLRERK